jgi:hypothetical protein
MSDVYDWAADEQRHRQEWQESYMPRRTGEVARQRSTEVGRDGPQDRLNHLNGHALDCGCPRCPGWYEARARMAVAAQAYAEPVVREVRPRPMMDVVLPVAVLMVVFSLCAMVLLPVVMPLVALSVALTGFLVVCLCILGGMGLIGFTMFRRTAHEAGGPVIRGKVLRRR